MDAAINHKEMRIDNRSDFLVDDFFDICVPVLNRCHSIVFPTIRERRCASGTCSAFPLILITSGGPFALKTEKYSFGKDRLKTNNKCRWSTV